MNTPQRYKLSEVGLIPTDWEVKNISSCCSIKARIGWQGLTKAEYLKHGDYVLITATDFENGFINWASCAYVSKERFEQDPNIQIKPGDVLISKDGTIGKVAFLPSIPMEGTLNSGVFVVRPQKDFEIDQTYLSLIFKSVWFKEFIHQLTAGSTIVHLYQKDFVKFNLVFPKSIDEQRQIAAALSEMDDLIAGMGEQIEKKRRIKKGAMQQLLTGKKRLPNFTDEWVEKQLWELTIWDKFFNEVPSHMQSATIKYPYVLANVFEEMERQRGDVLLLSTGNYIGWTTEEVAGKHLCNGEVVAIPWGGKANVKYAKGKFVTSDNRLATSSNLKELDNKYLYYVMLYREDEIDSYYRGASIKHPSMLDVLTMTIKLPKINEQHAIVETLSAMDDEINALESEREKYTLIKQGMMQELLTGKTRLI